jgi:hypothetical protein
MELTGHGAAWRTLKPCSDRERSGPAPTSTGIGCSIKRKLTSATIRQSMQRIAAFKKAAFGNGENREMGVKSGFRSLPEGVAHGLNYSGLGLTGAESPKPPRA